MRFLLPKLGHRHVWCRLFVERLTEPLHLNVLSMFVAVFGSFRAKVAFDRVSGSIGSLTSRLTSDGEGIAVGITTIDRWARDAGGRVTYIKGRPGGIRDAGASGATQTIAEDRPRIGITCYHRGTIGERC
jgi:hypothetical protein